MSRRRSRWWTNETASAKECAVGLIDDRLTKNAFVRSLDFIFNWARRSSLWWLQLGLGCCGMELITAQMPCFDMGERFGSLYRTSPPPGRPDDCGRHRDEEDGADSPRALGPGA